MTDRSTESATEASTPAAPASDDVRKILAILEEIRPYLQRDGGDCEFVSYENRLVNLRLHGACGTCPSSLMTLRMGIENAIREQVPDIQGVVNVDAPQAHDHAGHSHAPHHG